MMRELGIQIGRSEEIKESACESLTHKNTCIPFYKMFLFNILRKSIVDGPTYANHLI
jgi:hypothetical protein